MQRRRALELLGTLAALPALPALARLERLSDRELLDIGERAHRDAGGAPRALTPAQYRLVAVTAEHIIPRTATPGATDAQVADFVDVMLADWYTPTERDRFLAGLTEFDARAAAVHGKPFADCTSAQQIAMLTMLDAQVAALRANDPRAANEHWFGMLKFLTVWGYHTSRAVAGTENPMTGRYDGNAPYRAGPS